MTALLLTPVVLSVLVLGAHFLRGGHGAIVLLLLLTLPLLAVRRPWVRRVLQAVLVLGALEWVRTLVSLVQLRMALGQPYTRMAVILGAVALVTLLSALVLETRRLRARYSR